jgi:hypothetical protein
MGTGTGIAAGCLTTIGGALGTIFIIFVMMIVTTFFSGVAGWVVGWAFPYVTDTLRELARISLTDFQLGATLGFFGSAFRSSSISK